MANMIDHCPTCGAEVHNPLTKELLEIDPANLFYDYEEKFLSNRALLICKNYNVKTLRSFLKQFPTPSKLLCVPNLGIKTVRYVAKALNKAGVKW